MEWNLAHYDIDREEVESRLYKIDFLSDDSGISEERIDRIFRDIAEEKHIQPHISRSEIISEIPEVSIDAAEFRKNLKLNGLTEEQIEELVQQDPDDDRTALIDYRIDTYIRRGFIIDE